MRIWRLVAALFLLMLAVGCIDVDTRIKVFQDGSGTYFDYIEVESKLLDLAMGQENINSYDDMLALAYDELEKSVAEFEGIRLLDMKANWDGKEAMRIETLIWFDSIATWNKFALATKKPSLKFDAKPIKKGAHRGQTMWTLKVKPTGTGLPGTGADAGMSEADLKRIEGMESMMGTFNILLTGPGDVVEVPQPPEPEMQSALAARDSVTFSGGIAQILKDLEFEISFRGAPLDEDALAAAKQSVQVEPSKEFGELQEIVAAYRERLAVQEAATLAVGLSGFRLALTIDEDQMVGITTTRLYAAPIAPVFVAREALLHSMVPELNANYDFRVDMVESENGKQCSIVRTRKKPLPLSELGGLIQRREDAGDIVYTIDIPALLEVVPEGTRMRVLGEIVVNTPTMVIGTTGYKKSDRQVELMLPAFKVVETNRLVVRVAGGE
ncbi:MAG: hypothetical protein P9L99_17530 [Candidatus Lernaella stagnicola]|nr:hypothetical protein [Candidatus Lernaella stagnicola]